MQMIHVSWSGFSGACCFVLQVAGERLNPVTWTAGGLSVTQTATSFLLATSHMTLMRASSKISSWVCFLEKQHLCRCCKIIHSLNKYNFFSCSIWKCCGAADQHQRCWWETAQLWICGLWRLWPRAKNPGGQGRRGMYWHFITHFHSFGGGLVTHFHNWCEPESDQ